jgi:hypothetical protein
MEQNKNGIVKACRSEDPEISVGEATAEPFELHGANAISRGVMRYLRACRFSAITELPLANSRRADILAVGQTGEVLIVEIKSSVTDFRSDQKWKEYRDHCDRFFFAVPSEFPHQIIPDSVGLIKGDAYGAELIRESDYAPLSSARRKAVLIRFARISADRYANLVDPYFTR